MATTCEIKIVLVKAFWAYVGGKAEREGIVVCMRDVYIGLNRMCVCVL